ncbi:MAG: hypothetical protein J6U89_01040 [Bacteroidaceae bacterium]|nr:hypothetical protein [Bacteroidaceae bacterium]
MKRFLYAILLILPLAVSSQNMYNMSALFDNSPSGSARFLSMGGSMGALGGDISVMGTNPAGTAVYRSSDFNLTGMLGVVDNKTMLDGKNTITNYTGTNMNNAGFVMAFDVDTPPVKFVNFGVGYRRKANVGNNLSVKGNYDGFSQQYLIDYLYRQSKFDIDKMTADMYSNFGYNWLALLAADAKITDDEGNFLFYPAFKNDEDDTWIYDIIYNPDRFGYYSEERGGLDVFDVNLSVNIEDRVYVGATLGYYKLDYSRHSSYYEADEHGEIYTLENNYKVNGSGFDFKLGAIFRPFKYSPFKVAAFVHTPVFYKLIDSSSASMFGPFGEGYETKHEDCFGDELYVAYSLRTPWRFGASMSYTFGKYVALNAEYEYSDISDIMFTDGTDADKAQNEEILYNLKQQHTVRLGAELSLGKFAFRAGYNYISSPFRADAFKFMDNAAITDTSTEFINRFDKNIATCGIGYAGEMLYFDVAYMYQRQNADFSTYYDIDLMSPAPVASVKTTSHSVVASVGIRF